MNETGAVNMEDSTDSTVNTDTDGEKNVLSFLYS